MSLEDGFHTIDDEACTAYAEHGAICLRGAELAAAVMRSDTVQLFHDHVLVKEPSIPRMRFLAHQVIAVPRIKSQVFYLDLARCREWLSL